MCLMCEWCRRRLDVFGVKVLFIVALVGVFKIKVTSLFVWIAVSFINYNNSITYYDLLFSFIKTHFISYIYIFNFLSIPVKSGECLKCHSSTPPLVTSKSVLGGDCESCFTAKVYYMGTYGMI